MLTVTYFIYYRRKIERCLKLESNSFCISCSLSNISGSSNTQLKSAIASSGATKDNDVGSSTSNDVQTTNNEHKFSCNTKSTVIKGTFNDVYQTL